MTSVKSGLAVLALAGSAGCSPALNWREFTPEGSGIVASFPCRPDRLERRVPLAGASRQMTMLTCEAGGATFALAFVNAADPAGVAATLTELRAIAMRNVQATAPQVTPTQVPGMTPNMAAWRVSAVGRLPDGGAVHTHAAFFTRGLRVYQATVIGAEPPLPAVQAFFDALRFPA